MTNPPSEAIRFDAIRLLAAAASSEHALLADLAAHLDIRMPEVVPLARRTLADCGGAGNWREARAEAECRLRRQCRGRSW